MYKIPDDSVVEDEIPVKSYFKSKNTVSLDETVRNHGRSDVSSCSAKAAVSSSSFAKPSASSSSTDAQNNKKNGSTVTDTSHALGQSNINVAAQVEDNAEKNAHKNAINTGAKSLSDAFSYIKDTEFYNENDAEKAVQENRKRKIVDSKSNDKSESPKKSEVSQVCSFAF